MNWIDRLERRLGAWCIPQFALFIVMSNGLIYLLNQMQPEFAGRLMLNPDLIRAGEWWRVITFLFVPPNTHFLWMALWLLFLYSISLSLEQAWGDFKFFWFYMIGGIATIVAALSVGTTLSNIPLNTTLFLAFATLFPDHEVLLFFIIPVKVKYLAWLTWAALGVSFILGGTISQIAIGASLVNYLLFFGPMHVRQAKLRWEVYRNRRRMGSSD